MTTKRRRTNVEADPKWRAALHKAQDWHEAGLSHRKIAERLTHEGFRLSKGKWWTDTAVTRALDRHPKHPVEYPVKFADFEDPNSYIEVAVFDDDGRPKDKTKEIGTAHHPGDFEDHEQYMAFQKRVEELAHVPIDPRSRPQRAYPKLEPKDWTVGGESIDWTNTWSVGSKNWDEKLVPMVAKHVAAVNGSFLDRIDRLAGDPVDKAKLRTQYLGLMRRLAMREETVLALKLEVKRLKNG